MEAGALKAPPALLERIVLLLTPPAAREAVVGDLCELYSSPPRFAYEALCTLPFVVASQIRRNINLPVLALQGVLVFCLFGADPAPPAAWTHAALPTLLVLFILSLQSAYHGAEAPSAQRAALETVLVAAGVLIVFVSGQMGVGPPAFHGLSWLVVAAGSLPVLSLFRICARLTLESDRHGVFADLMTADDIVRDYQLFERNTRRRNRIEIAALAVVATTGALVCRHLSFSPAMGAWSLVGIYAAAGLYLYLAGMPRALPARADFLSLRTAYRHELARQNQLRGFMWWLWLTPLLLEIYIQFDGHGLAQPRQMPSEIVATILLCFFVATINSERGGRTREKIGALALMRERRPQLYGTSAP